MSVGCVSTTNFQDLSISLLGNICPFFMLLPFISCYMIDFLFIEKVKFSPRSLPMKPGRGGEVYLHPFSFKFEHPADAHDVPASTDSVGECGKRHALLMCTNQLFQISFFVGYHLPGCSHCVCRSIDINIYGRR